MRTGYTWDKAMLGHDTSRVHPERPERIERLDPTLVMADVPGIKMVKIDPHLGVPWAKRVHGHEYVNMVLSAHQRGQWSLDATNETLVKPDTADVASLAASACVSMTAAVLRGEIDNGFAAIRPPGHHAGRAATRGFCIFNNAALCAEYARTQGCESVLIVDWDVHPADGTGAIFYECPVVHVLSIHQDGIFSSSVGLPEQRGKGAGEGTLHNVPLEAGSSKQVYLAAFEKALADATAAAKPDLLIISCGFDAHSGDPIGKLNLDDDGFVKMTHMMKQAAKQYCGGKLVSILEGGYNPTVIARCSRQHLEALMD